MAIILSLFQLAFLLSNVWTSYKTLKPAPASRRRDAPSVRALAARKRELKACLSVWIVWATWSCAERLADRTVGILIPFYTDIKTVFLMALFFTRAMIAEPLLLHFIRPTLKPYISTIDATLDLLNAIAHVVAHFALAPWRYFTSSSSEPSDEEEIDSAEADTPPYPSLAQPISSTPAEQQTRNHSTVEELRQTWEAAAPPSRLPTQPRETIIQTGTRTRRGLQATNNDQARDLPRTRSTVRLRLDDSPVDVQPPQTVSSSKAPPPQPFILPFTHAPSHPILDVPRPQPTPPPAYSPSLTHLPSHIAHPSVTHSPRFPGGYATSTTTTSADHSETTDQSMTAVPSAPANHSPSSFSFPEPPPIEMFTPGLSKPSELPRPRLRTISTQSPPVPAVVALPVPTAAPAVVSAPAPTPREPVRAAVPPISVQSKYVERFPAASSATAAAEAKRAVRTYAMYEPTLSKTAMPQQRNPSVPEQSSHPPTQHPVSSATLARRQRLASTSSLRMEMQNYTTYGETPLSALEPTIAKSRAKQPAPIVVAAVAPAAGPSSASSTSSRRSARSAGSGGSGGVAAAAGKKRSAKGHVVEKPRVAPTTSEVESAAEGDEKDSTGSAKKKRKVDDAPPAPSNDAPAPVVAPVPAPVPVLVPTPAPISIPVVTIPIPQPVVKAKQMPAIQKVVELADRSYTEDDTYSDDDSAWSAFDELKTPNRKALSLRSRTVFSDDDNDASFSESLPPPVPALPRPALSVEIPVPTTTTTRQTQARPPPYSHHDPAGLDTAAAISSISDFPKPDAFASIAAVRGARGNSKDGAASQDVGGRFGSRDVAPPISVSKGNAAAAARGRRLRSGAGR